MSAILMGEGNMAAQNYFLSKFAYIVLLIKACSFHPVSYNFFLAKKSQKFVQTF